MTIKTPEVLPEKPKDNLREIAKLTPRESVTDLTKRLEDKSAGMEMLVQNQKDERAKEVAMTAKTSVDARLELVHAMA